MTKRVKYWTTGTRQENVNAVGKPSEMLRWLLGFPPSKDVPPLAVANDVFRKGFREGGFNGDTHWEPFELSPADYDDFVIELVATAGYRTIESPEWIETELDWMAFVASKRKGVPLEPYRKLLYRYTAMAESHRIARERGGKLLLFIATLRMYVVMLRMQKFLAKYAGDDS